MRNPNRWLRLAIVLPFLVGCALVRETPTPLPWLPTETTVPTGEQQQIEPTPTLVPATPSPTPAPSTPTPTTTSEPATATPPPPTATPSPEPSPTVSGQAITLSAPQPGQEVGNPVLVRGRASLFPFEGTLVIRIYDAHDRLAAEVPIIAEGEYGGPATFDVPVTYGGVPGPGRVELLDFSAMDGAVVAQATQSVTLSGFPGGGVIEQPAFRSDVTLPMKLLARAGTPGEEVSVVVRWDDGVEFTRTFPVLAGLDGHGLVMGSLGRTDVSAGHPPTQRAEVEIRTLQGSPLAWQQVRVLAPGEAGTMRTQVFWVVEEELVPQAIYIPRTLGIGRASLEALLWGPVPGNSAGYASALPSPQDVLSYPGRDAGWGEWVTLRSLTIVDHVAYADFSLELRAHSGGALQVTLIRQQIEATLLQFSTVDDVVITINGQPAMLEP